MAENGNEYQICMKRCNNGSRELRLHNNKARAAETVSEKEFNDSDLQERVSVTKYRKQCTNTIGLMRFMTQLSGTEYIDRLTCEHAVDRAKIFVSHYCQAIMQDNQNSALVCDSNQDKLEQAARLILYYISPFSTLGRP